MTPVQKKVIEFMRECGGTCRLQTGYRTTVFAKAHPTYGDIVGLSVTVLYGLRNQNLVELVSYQPPIYKLVVKR